MWAELVRVRGGLPVSSVGELASADPRAHGFVAVLVGDNVLLPLVARLAPAQAVALALEEARGDGAQAGAALAVLERADVGLYLLKHGRVGGGEGESGSREISREHIAAVLDALVTGSATWERDPDFGYEVATQVPGIEGADEGLLLPRFLYRRADRVYEHAALVAEVKRERREALARIPGLPEALVTALE